MERLGAFATECRTTLWKGGVQHDVFLCVQASRKWLAEKHMSSFADARSGIVGIVKGGLRWLELEETDGRTP
jgi:hypothetical protein